MSLVPLETAEYGSPTSAKDERSVAHDVQTVPVSHEEARLEREPITQSNRSAAMEGPPFSEAEHEVTCTRRAPSSAKQAVPKERVRLDTDTVTEQR